MHSSIYSGTIRHRRHTPASHSFSYQMFMMYLDLEELGEVFQGSRLFSADKRAFGEFRRADHFGDPDIPLIESVKNLVRERTGRRLNGPVRLLTHLRYFGYVFNPVSFFYCFDPTGNHLECLVAEVNNTPWGERHCYVLNVKNSPEEQSGQSHPVLRFSSEKVMHVSPFMPMDMQYDWRVGIPGEDLNLHMINSRNHEKVFDATLRLTRKELNPSTLARSLASYPFLTVKVMTAIHWQALRLWMKKVPFHPPPSHKTDSANQKGNI